MGKERFARYFFNVTPLEFIDDIDLSLLDFDVERSRYGVTVRVPMEIDHEDHQKEFEKNLNSLFIAYSMELDKPYTLEYGGYEKDLPDGRVLHGIVIDNFCCASAVLTSPTIKVYKDGILVLDPEDQRKKQLKSFSGLCNKYYEKNSTAKRIIDLYMNSILKPENQLFDLYKIRDILSKTLKMPKETTCDILRIEKNDWDFIGELCNSRPLFQGRHEIVSPDKLRDVETNELERIKGIVKKMIIGYLNHLDSGKEIS